MAAELDIIARLRNEAKSGLRGLKGDVKDVGQEVDRADKKATAFSKTLKVGLVAGAAAGAAAIGLAVVGFKKLGEAVQKGIELAGIQQDAETQLAQTIESTGMAAGLTADELTDMASSLQSVTTFGDETIIRGQALLLTFTNIGQEVFPRATESALDMALVFGSVDAAAIQLGKALNDPIVGVTALQRVGVSFTQSQKEQIRVLQESGDLMGAQTIILDELARQFGGQARAAAETFTGRMEQLKNVVGDGYEVLGFAFIPALTDLAEDALPIVTEAIETMSASLDTQLIPLVGESIDLLLAMGEAGGQLVSAGDDALTFEEAVRKTRLEVALFRSGLELLKVGLDAQEIGRVVTNFGRLAGATDDVTRRTNLLASAAQHLTNDAMVANIARSEQMTAAYGGQKTALSELEITTNLYIGGVEDMIEVSEEAAEALAEVEEAAQRTMERMQRLDTETGAYEVTAGQVAQAERDRADAHDAAAEASARAAEEATALQERLGEYFVAALPAVEATGSLEEALFNATAAVGGLPGPLAAAAEASGLFTQEQITTATNAAIFEEALGRMAAAVASGTVPYADAITALETLQSRLANPLPPVLIETNIEEATASLTTAEAMLAEKLGVFTAESQGLSTDASDAFGEMATAADTNMPKVEQAIIDAITNSATTVATEMPIMATTAETQLAAMATSAETNMTSTVTAVETGMGEVVVAVDTGWSEAVSTSEGYVPQFETVGTNMAGGMTAGVLAGEGALAAAVAGIVTAALAAGTAAAEASSPSEKAARDIGLPISQGIAEGALAGEKEVADAVGTVVTNAITAVSGGRLGEGGTFAEALYNGMIAAGVQTMLSQSQFASLLGQATGAAPGGFNPNTQVNFAAGGFTGTGQGIAGAVHRNEYVFDPISTRNIGAENLAALQAAGQSGPVSPMGGNFYFSPSISVSVQGGSAADVNTIRRIVREELTTVARDAQNRWRTR